MREGRLFKRGAIWHGRIRVAGREHQSSLRTADRDQARRHLKAWARELREARFSGAGHAWEEAVIRWDSEARAGLRPGTVKRYLVSVRQLTPFLTGRDLRSIDGPAIAAIVTRRRAAGASNATIRRDLTTLSRICAAAIGWGWLTENHARAYDRSLIRERRDPVVIPSAADLAALLAAAPPAFALLIRFLAATGMRQQEAAGLEWRDVSPDRREVTLTRTKTSRPRALRLTATARAILTAARRHPSSPYVFWHGPGQRYQRVAERFAAIARAVERAQARARRPFRRFRCHDLRHRFAVEALRAGWDIYTLSRYLGHASVKTTEIYLGYLPAGGHLGGQSLTKPPPDIRAA